MHGMEAGGDLSYPIIRTHHHLSGRILPSVYGHNLPVPTPPISLPITGVPPKLPPKPSWLRQIAQTPKEHYQARSLCSPYSDSSESSYTLDEDCVEKSDIINEDDGQDIAENTLLRKKDTIMLKIKYLQSELKHNA
jgi:hypothetical protein